MVAQARATNRSRREHNSKLDDDDDDFDDDPDSKLDDDEEEEIEVSNAKMVRNHPKLSRVSTYDPACVLPSMSEILS